MVREELGKLDPALAKLAGKNLGHIHNQVSYLEDRTRAEHKKQNDVIVRHFEALGAALQPMGKRQERCLCIYYYLSKYGPDFWEQLLREFPHDPGHYMFSWH